MKLYMCIDISWRGIGFGYTHGERETERPGRGRENTRERWESWERERDI